MSEFFFFIVRSMCINSYLSSASTPSTCLLFLYNKVIEQYGRRGT